MAAAEFAATAMSDLLWFLFFASWPVACAGLLFFFAKKFKARIEERWLQLLAGNALVLLFLCSVVFLGGEIYYRFFYDSTDSFNFTKTSTRWLARYYHKNAQNMRDDVDYQPAIPEGKRRILFLGDSFTAGQGIKNVADRFPNRIRAANPQWDVQVLADMGWDTSEQYKTLKETLRLGNALDVVVLVYCLNDVSDMIPASNSVAARVAEEKARQGWLLRNSYFASTVYYRWKASRDPDIANYYQSLVTAYRGPLWEDQRVRLKTLRKRVESNGGHLLVVTFPFLNKPLDNSYEFRFVHEQLAGLCRELQVPELDLLSVYQRFAPRELVVNRLDAHPNEFAHQLAADAIQKFLEENIAREKSLSSTNRP